MQRAAALGNPVAATALGKGADHLQQAVAKILEPWIKGHVEGAVADMLKPAIKHLQGCNVQVLNTDVTLSPVDFDTKMCTILLPENVVQRMRAFTEKAGWTSLRQQIVWLDQVCTMISSVACVEDAMTAIRVAWQAIESHTAISARICQATGQLTNHWKSWNMFTETSTDVFAPADGIFSETSTKHIVGIAGNITEEDENKKRRLEKM